MANNSWRETAELVGMLAIIAGLILVAYELRQNSDLMRAQISMERASASIDYLTSVANDGEIARIQAKLRQEFDDYPLALGMADVLTPEEFERFRFWIIARSNELSNDWYQCSKGYVEEDSCQRQVLGRVRRNMFRFYEFGIDYSRWPIDAVQQLQEFAADNELPEIGDDGTWE